MTMMMMMIMMMMMTTPIRQADTECHTNRQADPTGHTMSATHNNSSASDENDSAGQQLLEGCGCMGVVKL